MKVKRWSRPAYALLAILMIAAFCLNVLPLPIPFGGAGVASASTVETFTTSGNWTCPPGVTAVQVEVWGAGGQGGASWWFSPTWINASGGGGGAYSRANSYTVTPGGNYTIIVGVGGSPGGDSYFNNSTAVMAKGGTAGVICNANSGGHGGVAASGYGDTKYSGGDGYDMACAGTTGHGGGGGSSAGTALAGVTATSQTGATAPTGGGNGGSGGNENVNGVAGTAPGGGGGGSGSGSGYVGGAGAAGKVVLTYTVTPPTISTLAATSITTTSATLNGNVTSLGTYGNVTSYGFVLSTSTQSNPGNVSPSAQGNYTAGNWTWTGVQYAAGQLFDSNGNVTGLTAGTTYYFRAAGYSTYGWVYGNESSFKTSCSSVGTAGNWLTYNGVPYSNRRALGITAATNPAPANYVVPVDIHRGNKTVEDGNWTVNSKTYNNRVAFTVHTHDALAATYPLKIIVDTKTLVTGGFFGGSTSGYAKAVEWGNSSSDATGMKFWVTEAGAATPDNFNTGSTIYYVRLPSGLTANTDHTMYMYVDVNQSGASTNYSAANVFSFFEHFDTAAGNLTVFLVAYDGSGGTNNWDVSLTDPIIVVANSILTLDSVSYDSGAWRGIVPASFSITDWRMLSRITSTPEDHSGIGMITASESYPQTNSLHYQQGSTVGFIRFIYAIQHIINPGSYLIAPCSIELSKSGARYNMIGFSDTNILYPDTQYSNSLLAVDDIPFKPWVGSIVTGNITIDWIAVMPEMDSPPYVVFPDILYDKAGTVFLNGRSEDWPYDIAFTAVDGNTTLKWWADPLTELTKQPGDSMQAAIRVTDSLDCDSKIYIYYGHGNITSLQAEFNPEDTYSTFYDFTDISDWTDAAGYSIMDVENPVLSRGEVGNVGGQGGRIWAREPSVVKWGEGDYRMVLTNTLWEGSEGGWPAPARVYTAHADSPSSVFSPAQILFTIGEYEEYWFGYYNDCVRIYPNGPGGANRVYVFYKINDGCLVAYSDDFQTWTFNSNGPFVDSAWIDANDGGEFPGISGVMSITITLKGGIYYAFFNGVIGSPTNGGAGYAYNHEKPEDWTVGGWHYGDKLVEVGTYFEDADIVFDSNSNYWYWCITKVAITDNLQYYRIADAKFPGVGLLGNPDGWENMGSMNPVLAPFNKTLRAPRILQDGSDWYLYFSAMGIEETDFLIGENWSPNYVIVNKAASTGFPGNWTAQNVEKKYKQATTTGYQKAYITASSETNCSIITEVQLGSATTNYMAGILFRYNSSADTGYYAALDYNAGNPKVQLYKFNGASYTALNSVQGAVPYDIPQFPEPWLYPGYSWRLRVQCYGTTLKVAYSAWGNPWVETHSLTDATYSTGKVGVETNTAEAYFNNFRVRGFVLTEPIVGQASEELFDISNTPSSKGFGIVQPSQTYWANGTEPGWPLSAGDCWGNLTNNSSFAVNILASMGNMTGGTTWSIGSSPGNNIFTLKVGIAGLAGIGNFTTLSNTPVAWITSMAAGNMTRWVFVFYTPTNSPQFADGVPKSGNMTFEAEAS